MALDDGVLEIVELLDPAINVSGSLGFAINASTRNERTGASVAPAGDVNGDGVDDVVIAASFGEAGGTLGSGRCDVVFGSGVGFVPVFELSLLDGSNGFSVNGLSEGDNTGRRLGPAGDFNGDGFDDVVITTTLGTDSSQVSGAGQCYVIFGRPGPFPSQIDLGSLNGTNGFAIDGIAVDDSSGRNASSVGDLNGDRIDDLVISAPTADPNGLPGAGESYVIFGSADLVSDLSLQDGLFQLADLRDPEVNPAGALGFVLSGIAGGDGSGGVAPAGDVNGDSIDDLLVSAPNADPNGFSSGQTYVIYGQLAGCSRADIAVPRLQIDAFDSGAYFDRLARGVMLADLWPIDDGDGLIDVLDYVVFEATFAAGCAH
ncbi:MAG: integrin alpha [Planctomycetota bacterium]